MYIFSKNNNVVYQGNLYKADKNGPQNNTSTTEGYYVKNERKSIVILDDIKEEESLNINSRDFQDVNQDVNQNVNNIFINHDNENDNNSEELGFAYVPNYSIEIPDPSEE